MGRIIACLLTVFFASYNPALLACSPSPPDEGVNFEVIASQVPGRNVPAGAAQLKVKFGGMPKYDESILTLPIKQVTHGKFPRDEIQLQITNVDNCYSSLGEAIFFNEFVYITVLPMEYWDEEAVLDAHGNQLYGAYFYKGIISLLMPGEKLPSFAEYSKEPQFSFHEIKRWECINQGNDTAEAWRKCIKPGAYIGLNCENNNSGALVCEQDDLIFKNRPLDLKRGYNFWTAYDATIVTILLVISTLIGISYFSRVRAVT